MRLASAIRMGFYPTPPETQTRIANFLSADRRGVTRVLDPCAGYGVALKSVTDQDRKSVV